MVNIDIGTVRGSELTTNKDGDDTRRMLQVEMSNTDDIQTIEQMGPSGEDSAPQPDSRVIVVSLGPAYKVAIALDDSVTPTGADGEKILYSYDTSGTRIAQITLAADGAIVLANSGGTVSLAANGVISLVNTLGTFEMDTAGVVDINGNFTVDP